MLRKIAFALSLTMLAGCSIASPLTSLLGLGGGLHSDGTKGPRPGGYDWTVFVYMAADNSLSSAAPLDINEMEAGLSSDRVRFVVLVDQDQVGDSRIIEIKHDPGGLNEEIVSPTIDDKGAVIPQNHEVDTGDPKTLERFVQWGVKNYPSRRAMLVMWNHGGGAFTDPQHLKSFCWDDTSGSHLNLVDLWRTSQQIASKEKFDVIGFDTCLLGHLETAYQMRDLSSFLVSSEKTEPGEGWDYRAFAEILSRKPEIYPRELSSEIVKSFQAFYKKQDGNPATTLSAMDLEKVKERLVPAVNDLASDFLTGLPNSGFRTALAGIFGQTAQFNTNGEEDSVDLGLLGTLLQKNAALPTKTRAL
ncbi:MAG TPA: clostripain-related cysteine peptidase, partial [Chroococcales cyanobacterium]